VIVDLLPASADNTYRGQRVALWLFALMPLKILMGVNVMLHAPQVARNADGIPIETFGAQASSAFSFAFACWGLGQLVLGLASLVVLLRYRSLVPLVFLALLIEQCGRMLLRLQWPVERAPEAIGAIINLVLLAIMVTGLVLSLWRPMSLRQE